MLNFLSGDRGKKSIKNNNYQERFTPIQNANQQPDWNMGASIQRINAMNFEIPNDGSFNVSSDASFKKKILAQDLTVTGTITNAKLTNDLNNKASTIHNHSIAQITELQNQLNARMLKSSDTMSGNLNVNGNVHVNGTINGNRITSTHGLSLKTLPIIPIIAADGVMEVGRIIDMHGHDESGFNKDYDVRLQCDRPGGMTVYGDFSVAGKGTNNIFLQIYPVGAIYLSMNNTNPDILFGGTWEGIHGKFMYCNHPNEAGGRTGVEGPVEVVTSINYGSATRINGRTPVFNPWPPWIGIFAWKRTK